MILPILHYPHKNLRTVAKPVVRIDEGVRMLVKNMFETMYEAKGVGLAATQIDYHERIIVLDVSEERDQPLCLINPEIIQQSGKSTGEEGCLSIPDYRNNVVRAAQIKVRALNAQNKVFELEAQDLLSVCIQHEIDHLNGILFVDHLSKLKQNRLLEKTKKALKVF